MGIIFRGKAKDFRKYMFFLEYVMGFYGMTLEEMENEIKFKRWLWINTNTQSGERRSI